MENINNEFVLEMLNISKEFPGVKALSEVNLKVKPGTVHALMGENGAGKSTLMKCLFGIYQKNSGKIFLDSKEVNFQNTRQALDNGVSMVHQELNQVRQRNILDNIWLGRYPKKGLFIDEQKMYEDTVKIFKDLDITVDPRQKVGSLSVSQMQMVEIAKAVSYDSKVIVMDEPTSSLTEKEVEHLFRIINKLRKNNVAIIYISHKMEEILKISDYVTVMRDGQLIGTKKSSDITIDNIISMMVGRDMSNRFPPKQNHPGEIILEVEGLTENIKFGLKDVSFSLKKGEILGIAGLVGSKRTEIVEALFGMRKIDSGKVKLHNKEIINKNPRSAMENGFALVTEERRSTGIFPQLSIEFNSTISNMNSYRSNLLFLSNDKLSY